MQSTKCELTGGSVYTTTEVVIGEMTDAAFTREIGPMTT
jgi:predicted DNA-binding protein with PD1-like motif